MKFNVNDFVCIRLTDLGRQCLRENYDALGPLPFEFVPVKEDSEGWSRWQLWELMQQLGKHCGNGFPLVFETEIRIDTYTE